MLVNQLQVVMNVMMMMAVGAGVEVEEEIVCLTLLQRSPLLASLDLSNNATDAGATCDV